MTFKNACLVNSETGEMVYNFSNKQVALGAQYLTATTRAMGYQITNVKYYGDLMVIKVI